MPSEFLGPLIPVGVNEKNGIRMRMTTNNVVRKVLLK